MLKGKINNKIKIIILISLLLISFLSYCFYPIISYSPDYENEPWRIYLTDRNWVVITDKAKKWWYKEHYIIYNKHSKLIKSIIKIEDKNYYNHYWINILSKFRAIKDNISWKKISWWSTITEQYIKNKYFQGNKRTYLQKLREATLSFHSSLFQEKNIILDNYLNNIYLWNKIYGLSAASNIYFDKTDIDNLSNEEIVIIISLINNPSIKSLKEKKFSLYSEKIKLRLWFNYKSKYLKLKKKENIDIFPFVTNNNIDTIDAELQEFSKNILNKTLEWLKWKNVTNWAIFAINPRTKEILIYQWSKDFYSDNIDWEVDVITSNRQPWSTMKPFLYLLALLEWANPDNFLIDLETEYNTAYKNRVFMAQNYSLKEFWLVRFKKALWNSLNNSSVRLGKELWLEKVYNFYKDFWFKLDFPSDHYWYSLVLGNPSIRLKDLVYSYSRLVPDWINVNKFLLYDILSNPDNRDISFWVNSILNTSIPQAVKTWTSSDFRDNLIVSYHPDLVIWIWIWNNDNSSMIWVTWITWAWYIWHQIIEKAISLWYIQNREIEIPNWIEKKDYCLDEKCYRKEIVYSKPWVNYESRIVDNIYSENDIFEELIWNERSRLEEKWFLIQ